jgi:hypothetical protein
LRTLTADELSRMQATQQEAMPDTAEVRRPTRTPDGMGGTDQALTLVASAACRVDKVEDNPLVAQFGERIGTRQAVIVRLPAGTDVQPGDQITVGAELYEAISVPVGSWETARPVLAAYDGTP